MFWNYLAKYSYFKTRFSKNQVIHNQTKKKKKTMELEFHVNFSK